MDILINILSPEVLESHLPEFIEILKYEPHEYWQEDHFRLLLPGKYDLSVVAFSGKNIAGYIIASLKESGPYIHKFMVRKDIRSMSVGEKMLVFFENNLTKKGYSGIKLTVREENERAIKFYKKNNFNISGKRTDSADNYPLIIMTKNLIINS